MIQHIITQEDLINNPCLIGQCDVGDVVEFPEGSIVFEMFNN